jgi:hypothetical protein
MLYCRKKKVANEKGLCVLREPIPARYGTDQYHSAFQDPRVLPAAPLLS